MVLRTTRFPAQLLSQVQHDHSAFSRLKAWRTQGISPSVMRKQHPRSSFQPLDSSELQFELTDPSGKNRSNLQLPCTSADLQHILTSCPAPTTFSTHKGARLPKRRRHQWHSHQQQPCFASLLQSFQKSKPESQLQPAEVKDKASGGLQTAAGWSKHLLCGALSAVVSRTTMAPLERIKLEIVLHKRQETMFEVALGVLERDGKSGFWKGNGINLLRTAPYKVG